jgi:hypothetical protein
MSSTRMATLVLFLLAFIVTTLASPLSSSLNPSSLNQLPGLAERSTCGGVCIINILHGVRMSLAPVLKSCRKPLLRYLRISSILILITETDRKAGVGAAKCAGNMKSALDASVVRLQMSARGTYNAAQAREIASLLLSIIIVS